MYHMFLGGMHIPIPPPKMQLAVKNKNKTVSLVNVGEVNIIKEPGLTEIAFEIMLPNSNYPFNQSFLKFMKAEYYLKKIKKLKTSKRPFQFIVVRMKGNGTMLFNTNIRVTLESYDIKESFDDGFDCIVAIKLKQYREFGTKKVVVTENKDGEKFGHVEGMRASNREIPSSIKSNGGSLWSQLKEATGNGDAIFNIASINNIAMPVAVAMGEVINLK